MTSGQSTILVGALVLVGLLGIGVKSKNETLEQTYRECVSQGTDPTACSCLIGKIDSEIPAIHDAPLLGRLVEMSEARISQIRIAAVKACLPRYKLKKRS